MPITVSGGMVITGGLSTLDAPALSLDFMSGTLDSRITFSRGTQATMVDSTGRLTYAPNNLVTQSEFINGVSDAPTRSGLLTATTFPFLSSNKGLAFGYDGTTSTWAYKSDVAVLSATYVFSVYVEMTDGLAPNFGSTTNSSNLNSFIIVIGGSGVSAPTYTVQSVGGNVYRVSAVRTVTSIPANNTGVVKFNTNDNRTFKVSGYQLEQVTYQTTPRTYNATTTSAYYGPRFDYDPISLQLRGLLMDPQRTNLMLQSENFTVSPWAATIGGTSTVSNLNSSLGFMVSNVTATSANGGLRQSISVANGQVYTLSFYVSSASTSVRIALENGVAAYGQTCFVDINPSNGTFGTLTGFTSASSSRYGSGYLYQITLPAAGGALAANVEWRITNNGDSIIIGRPQFELGPFATSYIPTVASTVTRNADNMVMTGTNFSSWYNQSQGTIYVNLVPTSAPAAGTNIRFLEISGASTDDRNPLLFSSSTLIFSQYRVAALGTSNQAQLSGATNVYSANNNVSIAAAYSQDDFATAVNGSIIGTAISGTPLSTANKMTIGYAQSAPSEVFSGWMRGIQFYSTRLPNAQLQGITTL